MNDDDMVDLVERLTEKAEALRRLADRATGHLERARLDGKVQGIDLALSFIFEVQRTASA